MLCIAKSHLLRKMTVMRFEQGILVTLITRLDWKRKNEMPVGNI